MEPDGREAPRTSSLFNFADSDITIESLDAVRFLLHRKNLETHTEAFPGSELQLDITSDDSDVVILTEPAEILEILFQFIYPRKQPVLSALGVDTLLALAEAVQKYQVFSAMNGCESQLRKYVEGHSLNILVHALRHYGGYETLALVDECARLLIRKGQTLAIVRKFADEGLECNYIVRWIEYETMWEELFKKVKSEINGLPLHEECWINKYLCSGCHDRLISWVDDLRDIATIPALREALNHPIFLKEHQHCRYDDCVQRARFADICRDLVKSMPDFTWVLDRNVVSLGGIG